MNDQKLYPSLNSVSSIESALNQQLKEINSFQNSVQNIKDIRTFYSHEVKKYKKKCKTIKLISGMINCIDTFVIVGVTSTSITLSVTGFGLLVIPITSGVGAGFSLSGKIISEYLKHLQAKYTKKHALASKTLEQFAILHSKCLTDNKIDQSEYLKLTKTYDVYKHKRAKIAGTFLD